MQCTGNTNGQHTVKPPSHGKLQKVDKLAFSHNKLHSQTGTPNLEMSTYEGFDSMIVYKRSHVNYIMQVFQHKKVGKKFGQKVGENKNLF